MAKFALLGPAYPYRGGIAQFTDRLAEALARRHEVALFTFSRQYPAILFPGRSQYAAGATNAPAGQRILDSINPLSWFRTGRRLADEQVDYIILSYWMPFMIPAYLGVIAAMRRKAKKSGARPPVVVLWLHNLLPHERVPFARFLTGRLLSRCDRFVCLSRRVGEDVEELQPGAPLLTAFHPVYDIYSDPVPKAGARRDLGLGDRPILLFFGLVRRYKGLDILLRAMPLIHRKKRVQLVVAGEFYEDRGRYFDLSDSLGLARGFHAAADVRFVDQYIPDEKVHLYFSAADLVVQPYRDATQSGVVQTAYFFGRPVVVTDVGGLSEVVQHGETGYVVPPDDPARIAEAVLAYFENKPEQLTENAAQQRDRYSWDRLMNELDTFLSDGI